MSDQSRFWTLSLMASNRSVEWFGKNYAVSMFWAGKSAWWAARSHTSHLVSQYGG